MFSRLGPFGSVGDVMLLLIVQTSSTVETDPDFIHLVSIHHAPTVRAHPKLGR